MKKLANKINQVTKRIKKRKKLANKIKKELQPIKEEQRELNFEYYYKNQKTCKGFRKNQVTKRIKKRKILAKLKIKKFVVGYNQDSIDVKYYNKLYRVSFSSSETFSISSHKENFIEKVLTKKEKIV